MPGKLANDAIISVRCPVEKYREDGKNFHLVFVNVEEARDHVSIKRSGVIYEGTTSTRAV